MQRKDAKVAEKEELPFFANFALPLRSLRLSGLFFPGMEHAAPAEEKMHPSPREHEAA
jgi:hypothetical protein